MNKKDLCTKCGTDLGIEGTYFYCFSCDTAYTINGQGLLIELK